MFWQLNPLEAIIKRHLQWKNTMRTLFCSIILLLGTASSAFAEHVPTAAEQVIINKNKEKFAALKKYDLPAGQYAIGGSGPLGIRGIREIHDIDIIVSDELRDSLLQKYEYVDDGIVKKIVFPTDDIEAFWEGSFYTLKKDPEDPTIKAMISHAEIIDGLPFESLDDVMYYKRKMNRPKDLEDFKLIEKWKSN
jgi:hypothetical protein